MPAVVVVAVMIIILATVILDTNVGMLSICLYTLYRCDSSHGGGVSVGGRLEQNQQNPLHQQKIHEKDAAPPSGNSVALVCSGEAQQSLAPQDSWIVRGKVDRTAFCEEGLVENIMQCKTWMDDVDEKVLLSARNCANVYEVIKNEFFVNRAAMKMANIDAVFRFTEIPADLLYFADVCAGPGGFSEYVLWRKKWRAKGFGFTLKESNDFKEFSVAPYELFEPYYGVHGDGDVYKSDNLLSFKKLIMESTDNKGVHFMMADGGFDVAGKENDQEILSKRLYLCQFLCALMIVRSRGSFLCKLFDTFTEFSVGLVYLMSLCFEKLTFFKPVTSRPANSERYIVCEGKRPDTAAVESYMLKLNTNDVDSITSIVPLQIMSQRDKNFFKFMYDSNTNFGKNQLIALLNIKACVGVTVSRAQHARRAQIRNECLKLWNIPKIEFNLEMRDPDEFYKSLDLPSPPRHNTLISLSAGKFLYDNGWRKLDLKVEIPKNSLLILDDITHDTILVNDALFLSGVDVRKDGDAAAVFVKGIAKSTRPDLNKLSIKI
jgi:cap1 methyltransferase